jgi:hypothetical protein
MPFFSRKHTANINQYPGPESGLPFSSRMTLGRDRMIQMKSFDRPVTGRNRPGELKISGR